jgi:hypothetical protein
MVAWWWLLIVAWTSFVLGMLFWAVSAPYTMNEQPEQNARPQLDRYERAPEVRERNELELSRSPVRDEKLSD